MSRGATEAFIRAIQIERQKSYGFLPLIGAGFSAPSGVPLIEELKPYLRRCLVFALGEGTCAIRSGSHPMWGGIRCEFPFIVSNLSFSLS
jgi:hypothetical protein